MTSKRGHIRAVAPGENVEAPPNAADPSKPKAMSLDEAIQSGDYLEILRAQRRDIVKSLPDERGPAKAALHRQLALISKEIQALEARAKQEAAEDGDAGADEAWDEEAI
ncbi:hypothetical protein [Mycolicibacterium mageritense]|uniref:hypothetical protein n=1 Tax=Mycolicibacterium mageritense TaxID=53462 RepID=UPI001E2E410B|nr:hypothetical protein [Mycolicibacterium mageritense]GJJ22293.1 hypothetical protein MTY414_59660 [Mycolicibacterium mageritense]